MANVFGEALDKTTEFMPNPLNLLHLFPIVLTNFSFELRTKEGENDETEKRERNQNIRDENVDEISRRRSG